MHDGLVAIGIAVSLGKPLADVGRSLIRHNTECQRLKVVERLADKQGADAVSTLGHLLPPEPTADPRTPFPNDARRRSDAPAHSPGKATDAPISPQTAKDPTQTEPIDE